MNAKIKYMIPAFAAVIALAFAFAPSVLADDAAVDQMHARWDEGHHGPKGPMGPHAIAIEGFSGAIPIPQDMTKETHDYLKSQVTVSLSQAASIAEQNGLDDAIMAKIGVVDDGSDNRYLAWVVSAINKDVEAQTMTTNIVVVDAGDSSNVATTSQTFDHSMMKERMHGDKVKFEKFQKFSEHTGNADIDAARAKFLDLMQQLRDAYQNGDAEKAQALKDELHSLKQTIHETIDNGV